jgi:hypothetical protein
MKRLVTVSVALLVLVVSGLLHGFSSERWAPAPALNDAAARVAKVPLAIGDWEAEPVESDAAAFFQAGAQAYWTRSYVNTHTKDRILAILMCGRSGRMAAHTPEVCYRGAGYEMDRTPETVAVTALAGANLGTFWSARFTKDGGNAADLGLLWSWSAQGNWQASTQPRWDFGGEPFLYKLYLSHEDSGPANASTTAVTAFLRQLLPSVNQTLFDNHP